MFEETKAALAGRKRGRQSNSATPAETKKVKKNGHPLDSTPPASAKAVEWKPPSGSWEDHVECVDMCQEEDTGNFIVYLTWKNGKKTQHPKEVVYRRCPQKVRSKAPGGCLLNPAGQRSCVLTRLRCFGSTSATFEFLETAEIPSQLEA